MKRVVSASLGTRKRDKSERVTLLGTEFTIERRGVDGDLARFGELVSELDGKVDAIGFGGCDIYIVAGQKRWAFRQILAIAKRAKTTPVVDGSGLKHTLERRAIEVLRESGEFDVSGKNVLLVSAVDRFGMAEALAAAGAKTVFGDLLFGIGLPIPVRSLRTVRLLAGVLCPILTRLPFKWFYPTGEKQTARTPKYGRYFREADLICGDWHFIRKFMPDRLEGKTVLTQTVRKDDLELLKRAGVAQVITTTPVIGGETFATNVMEAAVVALLEKRPESMTERDYRKVLDQLDWKPNKIRLAESSEKGERERETVAL